MKIIVIEPNANGSRPPMQTWDASYPLPSGYVWCPDEFEAIYYSTNPAGFVNISHDGERVTDMWLNQVAFDEYVAAHPPKPPVDDEPTAEDILDVLLGVSADA